MSSRSLYYLSGISLLIGCVLLIIGDILSFFSGNNQASSLATSSALIRLIGAMLVVLGLPGMYARFAGQVNIGGLIGFTCTFLMFLVGMASEAILALIFPFLSAHGLLGGGHPPLGLLIFYSIGDLLGLIGGILLGIAVIRATLLPRWAGVLLIIGGILYAAGSILRLPIGDAGLIIFVVGLAWLAAGMLSQPPATVEIAHPRTKVQA